MQKRTLILTSVVSLALLSGWTIAQQQGLVFELPHSFQPNTPALSSEVNENFSAITDAINDSRTKIDEQTARVDALASGPADLIEVSPTGADFTSVAEALASITDASADRPFVVLVYPGVYTETELLLVPSFVHLKGLSRESVVIEGNRTAATQSDAAAIARLESDAKISDLTLINRGSTSTFAIGIVGDSLSSDTTVERVNVEVNTTGGVGHFAILMRDSDVTVRLAQLIAGGASAVNSAFVSTDSAAAFARPRIEQSVLIGLGPNSGFGMTLTLTAAIVVDSEIEGAFRGVSASQNGSTTITNSKVRTQGLNPVFEQNGSASILSATTGFTGGNPTGFASNFRYVHCFKSNFNPIVNGSGSSVQ